MRIVKRTFTSPSPPNTAHPPHLTPTSSLTSLLPPSQRPPHHHCILFPFTIMTLFLPYSPLQSLKTQAAYTFNTRILSLKSTSFLHPSFPHHHPTLRAPSLHPSPPPPCCDQPCPLPSGPAVPWTACTLWKGRLGGPFVPRLGSLTPVSSQRQSVTETQAREVTREGHSSMAGGGHSEEGRSDC